MRFISTILIITILAGGIVAQELPSNFLFKRETGQKTGIPVFQLIAHPDAIAYDAIYGNGFEALGLTLQPERNIYGVSFMNAKRRYQISILKRKRCSLNLDGKIFNFRKVFTATRNKVGKLRVEVVGYKINKEIYDKLVGANEVIARCGKVAYNLDKDNIDAIRYVAEEARKDLERRKK